MEINKSFNILVFDPPIERQTLKDKVILLNFLMNKYSKEDIGPWRENACLDIMKRLLHDILRQK